MKTKDAGPFEQVASCRNLPGNRPREWSYVPVAVVVLSVCDLEDDKATALG